MRVNVWMSVIALALIVAGAGIVTPVAAENKVVAKVDGKEITENDMKLAEAEIGSDLGNLPEETRRRVLVEYLIENQLFAAAADTEKLGSGDQFNERMQYWRRRALRDAYFDKNVKSSVSEAAAKTFYDDQVKSLKPEQEVQARHILVESEDQAKILFEKIAHGSDFAQMAKESSKDPGTKDEGGMLGYFSKGQMVPQFEEATFKLAKGEVSQPIQTQFGWHLIKVEDKREKQPPAFDQVKDRILNSMIHRKAQDVATQLRNTAKVEYLDPEIKKQIEEQAKRTELQKKMIEDQIKKMEAEEKGKAK